MQGGRLDRRIDIERKSVTQAPSGQPIETWSKIATRWAASVAPVSGDERFTSAQYVASEQVEFRIRYSSSVADVNPLDRILYPAESDSPPGEETIFNIISVIELGRREGLKIIAARRAES